MSRAEHERRLREIKKAQEYRITELEAKQAAGSRWQSPCNTNLGIPEVEPPDLFAEWFFERTSKLDELEVGKCIYTCTLLITHILEECSYM